MLTQEEITTNAAKFFKVGMKYGFVTDSLVESLGIDFVSKNGIRGFDYEGGLIEFALKVTDYAIKINDILPEEKRVEKDALIKFIFVATMADCVSSLSRFPRILVFALKNGIELGDKELEAIEHILDTSNVIIYDRTIAKLPTMVVIVEQAKELAHQLN